MPCKNISNGVFLQNHSHSCIVFILFVDLQRSIYDFFVGISTGSPHKVHTKSTGTKEKITARHLIIFAVINND
jgi:hypothetical protein